MVRSARASGSGVAEVTFTPDTMEVNVPTGAEATSLWADVWKRFRRNKLAVCGLVFIFLLLLIAVFADVIAPYSITERDSSNFRAGPSGDHWFGTDIIGRDVFSRVVFGARVSLRIGIVSTLLAMTIGLILDLDRPQGGTIRVSQQPLIDLAAEIAPR